MPKMSDVAEAIDILHRASDVLRFEKEWTTGCLGYSKTEHGEYPLMVVNIMAIKDDQQEIEKIFDKTISVCAYGALVVADTRFLGAYYSQLGDLFSRDDAVGLVVQACGEAAYEVAPAEPAAVSITHVNDNHCSSGADVIEKLFDPAIRILKEMDTDG